MPGDQDLLHRVQVAIRLFPKNVEFGGENAEFVGDVQPPLARHLAQTRDLALYLDNVALESEVRGR